MPTSKPLVIVVLGPTASGKTDLAIQLAEELKLNIHNVDSRQLYIGMDIGTAKPTKAQRKRISHSLIDLRHPNQPITLWEFQQEANHCINKTLLEKGMALLVGGSGLYLKGLIQGLEPPKVPPQESLRNQLHSLGQETCYQLLKASDLQSSSKIASADASRTTRALEVLYATGHSIKNQECKNPPPWRVLEIGLDPPNLKERISKRTKQMYSNGLIKETDDLVQKYGQNLSMLQTIGYQEALYVLQKRLTLNQAIEKTTYRTQKFAKRQRTWFRGQHQPHWLKDEEPKREAMTLIQSGLG